MPAAAAFLLLALAAPAAHASQVSLSGTTVTFTANPGEANRVHVNLSAEVEDLAGITPGPGCTALSPTKVECGVDYENDTVVPWDTFVVSLGDGDDTYWSSHLVLSRTTLDAGPGNDRIESIDANSGGVVEGGPGNDLVIGSSGDDRLNGGDGDDTIEGDRGNDVVDGGPGRDILLGDSSGDALAQGNDQLLARDGEQDSISCQFGSDRVTADAVDVVEELACESVDRPAVSAPAPGPETGSPGEPAAPARGCARFDRAAKRRQCAARAKAIAKCKKVKSSKRRTLCVKRAKAISRCKSKRAATRSAKRRKATCLRRAKRIGKR